MCLCKGTVESTFESGYRGSLSNRSRISPVTLRSHDLKLMWLQRSWLSRIMSRQPLHIRHSRHSSATCARKRKRKQARKHKYNHTHSNTHSQHKHANKRAYSTQPSAQWTNQRGTFICMSKGGHLEASRVDDGKQHVHRESRRSLALISPAKSVFYLHGCRMLLHELGMRARKGKGKRVPDVRSPCPQRAPPALALTRDCPSPPSCPSLALRGHIGCSHRALHRRARGGIAGFHAACSFIRAPSRGANGRRRRPCAPQLGKESVHLFRVVAPFPRTIQGGMLGSAPSS